METDQLVPKQAEQRANGFDRMLAPMPVSEFLGEYYERKPCIIRRKDADYYKHLLSFKAISDLLAAQVLRYPQAKLVNRSLKEPPKPESFTTNGSVIQPAHFTKYFAEGCTLALSGLHEYVPALGSLCDHLTKFFSHRFQTNIYLTPPTAQGFHPHYDTHDVFILQVEGSKLWRLFDTPLELPLQSQPFELSKVTLGPVSMEFTLNSGDLLYIPRGLMHDAEATHEFSLHITVGLLGYTWQDLLVETVLHQARQDAAFRKNLPPGFANAHYGGSAKEEFRELLARLHGSISVKESFDRFADKLQTELWPNLPGQLEQVAALGSISGRSVIRKREAVWYRRTSLNDKCQIHVYGQVIDLPAFMAPAIDHIDNSEGPFRVEEIPDCVDEKGKIVFVQRLVKEGLLQVLEYT